MTTPKEALAYALEYFDNFSDVRDGDYGEPEPNREMVLAGMCKDALASLQGEDAVERVAQTAQAFWQSPSGRSWIECCEKLPQQAEWFRRLARTILTTGLVPDEAAIRADEREKCARLAEQSMLPCDVSGSLILDRYTADTIAAAIRSNRREA